MTSTFYLTEKDLTLDFLNSLKLLYKKQAFSITISTTNDATEHLLGVSANAKHLDEAIHNISLGKTTAVDLTAYLK